MPHNDAYNDYYLESLRKIYQDPDPVSQNWELAHLDAPGTQPWTTSPLGGQWAQYGNVLQGRGALMGKNIGFNPRAVDIAGDERAEDQGQFQQLRNQQMKRYTPNLALDGLKGAYGR